MAATHVFPVWSKRRESLTLLRSSVVEKTWVADISEGKIIYLQCGRKDASRWHYWGPLWSKRR